LADFVPIHAVKFGIVITIADIFPNVIKNRGAVFGRKLFFGGRNAMGQDKGYGKTGAWTSI